MRQSLPSGTVTFLFTDVEASTKLLGELGAEGYADALAEHRRVIRAACSRHDGVEVDTQGDAFFFAFPTAQGAIDAAYEVAVGLEPGPIAVRIGLHTGTPLITGEGYVGADVHRAARIAAAGHGGQILVSSATAALIAGNGLRDLGEHRFKDLASAERVYQLGDRDFPALQSLYRTNLPTPATSFVGRERELADVVQLLKRDDVRLLTLTGAGGSGKTRLALQAAAEVAERYPDGVWWVGLAPLRDAALVIEAAAQTLGATGELGTHIGSRRMLVLLDNFEQVIDAAGALGALRDGCPNLDLLVTSREALHLAGEHEYAVPPLARDEAIGLFNVRAQAVNPDFVGDGAVAGICRRLDDLPLALELAAARVKVLTPERILERLESRLPVLTTGPRDAPDRQRTLRAAIDWSYELLAPDERRLLNRLSVFAGGCSLNAAEEVTDADLDVMQSLVDKSLVRVAGDRYWMLETIREYAAGRLAESDEATTVPRRHAEWFLALAERAEPELTASGQVEWLSRLDQDHANFRAALSFFRDAREGEPLSRMAGALQRFWYVRGYLAEGRMWLAGALALGSAQPLQPRLKVLEAAAQLAYRQGAHEEAKALNEEALTACRNASLPAGIGRALNRLADVAEAQGDVPQAERLWEESVATAREVGEPFDLGVATANLGSLMLTLGRIDRAIELTEQALALFRQVGHTLGVAIALENLGSAAVRQARHSDAVRLLRESLVLMREIGTPVYLAHVLDELAAVAAFRGDAVTAARLQGAVDHVLDERGGTLSPDSMDLRGKALAAVRERLDRDAFEAAYEAGAARSLDQALDDALERIGA